MTTTKDDGTTRNGGQAVDGDPIAPRLREVRDQFGPMGAPWHVVASVAIFRANKIVQARMEKALAPLDLTPARFELVGVIANSSEGRMSPRDLGRATLYHPATLTYTIDGLETRGLVKREPDPSDRRSILVVVTDAGRELVKHAAQVLAEITWGVEDLDNTEAETVATVLSRIHR